MCPWHGARYDVGTGRMVRGPQGVFEDWQLDDPAGRDIAAVIRIRDDIRQRVEQLMASLGITAADAGG